MSGAKGNRTFWSPVEEYTAKDEEEAKIFATAWIEDGVRFTCTPRVTGAYTFTEYGKR